MRHHGLGSSPISISPVLSNLQRRYILGRIQSDLRSPSSISNLQRRHLRPDSVRSPISISNLQSPLSIRGPGGGGGLKPSRRCAMDSFTMQKDLHPLFAPFCNLQSAHTISRRLWRKVRISTSVARSQATARTNSRSQTPLEHLHRRRFASTSSSIYCCSWQEICHLRDL